MSALLGWAGLAGLAGCGSMYRESPIQMDQVLDDRACPRTQAPVLLVLLPGAHMAPQEMLDQGLVQAVRQRRLAVDVLVADAHLGYIYDGSLLRRVHDEVIAPARARGVQRIWLAGISLGGYVAMGVALRYPGLIEGIVALAPYLGRRPLVQAVDAAGGAARWRQTAQPRDAQDVDHELWMWLSQPPTTDSVSATLATPTSHRPALYLGYGLDDRFAQGHALMAATLPPGHVSTAPGGHDWPPWRMLWSQWLDRGLLPQTCGI